MKWIGSFAGRRWSSTVAGSVSRRSRAVSVAWLALAGAIVVGASGCVSQQLPAFQRGTSCSSRKVQQYAKERGMTYQQALDEIRKEDAQKWAEYDKQQAELRAKHAAVAAGSAATVPTSGVQPTGPQ